MILLLGYHHSLLASTLKRYLIEWGQDVLLLDPQDLVYRTSITFYLDHKYDFLRLQFEGNCFYSSCIKGIFTEFDVFPSILWSYLSTRDAEYASFETTALWYSILSHFDCPRINPPAENHLGGSIPAPVELYLKAYDCGLDVHQQFFDGRCLNTSKDELNGEYLAVIIVDKSVAGILKYDFNRGKAIEHSALPEELVNSILNLHREIGLIMAEYHFAVTPGGGLKFITVQKLPLTTLHFRNLNFIHLLAEFLTRNNDL